MGFAHEMFPAVANPDGIELLLPAARAELRSGMGGRFGEFVQNPPPGGGKKGHLIIVVAQVGKITPTGKASDWANK
jgi:hypothetical protein